MFEIWGGSLNRMLSQLEGLLDKLYLVFDIYQKYSSGLWCAVQYIRLL